MSLILSDVIGDPLDIIASGPTTVDASTAQDALAIIHKYGLETSVAGSILHTLQSHAKQHAIASSDVSSEIVFANVLNIIVGSNFIALKAAELAAQQLQYDVQIITSTLSGSVQNASDFYTLLISTITDKAAATSDDDCYSALANYNVLPVDVLKNLCVQSRNALNAGRGVCLLAGGETVVTVTGKGQGGRCQHLCLTAAHHLAHLSGDLTHKVTLLCAGTDGQDGPTDAAGAFVTGETAAQAAGQDLDIDLYLANNDSYTFFSTLNSGLNLIKTGPTGTNVMDIHVILILP